MLYFKREMSAPNSLIDSKAWRPFYLNYYHHIGNARQKHEE